MTSGRKLDDLYDALIDEILGTSDEEIVAEVTPDDIERTKAAFARAEQEVGSHMLAAAKSGVRAWRASSKRETSPEALTARRTRFDEFRSTDAEFRKKSTLAARNGEKPTERDLDGLADDLDELSRLEGQREKKED